MGELINRQLIAEGEDDYRVQLKVGNRDVYGLDFRWIPESQITARSYPAAAVTIERAEWGNLYGTVSSLYSEGELVAREEERVSALLAEAMAAAEESRERMSELEHGPLRVIDDELESLRLRERTLKNRALNDELAQVEDQRRKLWAEYDQIAQQLTALRHEAERHELAVAVEGRGQEVRVNVNDIVRIYHPNEITTADKAVLYGAKAWEFLSGTPRESNTEGGIFPALFGTVMMVMLMTLAVVPFGVLAALYLREYARQGVLVRTVRIAVNNLAGVPSIVFGMFGLGFFVYGVGGTIDQLFYQDSLPTPTFGTGGILWASLTLALLTLPVVIVTTEEALSAVPSQLRDGSLALGSTKLQMIWRVVLPSALPGILAGVILATARGAGEVAPLMITGVVKLAPDLAIDALWPFLHLERKFMHLGFHIYDVGFQSPNVEAARPMVYATTLLLLAVVLVLNLTAIVVRNRLRKRYAYSTF